MKKPGSVFCGYKWSTGMYSYPHVCCRPRHLSGKHECSCGAKT